MCPICNSELSSSDAKELQTALRFLTRYINKNPIEWLVTLSLDMIRVGRIIYYDFSRIPKVDYYLYCAKCGNYFLQCPECGELLHMGTKGLIQPVNKVCSSCKKAFVYLEYQNPEDVIDHSQYM